MSGSLLIAIGVVAVIVVLVVAAERWEFRSVFSRRRRPPGSS